MIESYTDSVQRYESVFTKQFADKGYQWDVYVNTDDLKEFTDYPLLVCPTRLLRDKSARCSSAAALCMILRHT